VRGQTVAHPAAIGNAHRERAFLDLRFEVACGSQIGGRHMPKYVIEREIPGAGKLSPDDLHAISQKSCGVLNTMGPRIQWVHSYVTDDKIYCVYNAPNEEMVREHARQGGFPANKISRVMSVIDPTTGD
jgi:hypothetical protein